LLPGGLVPLWAVHISDGVLTPLWQAGGFGLAGVLAFVAARRLRDEDIAKVGLMTAAFFVVSSLNIRLGPTSVHLLLNGLVGVVLGWQAALAIPIGLFLQAALMQHGGFLSLGVNSCVMVLPALLAWQLFAALSRVSWLREPGFRSALVVVSTLAWILSLVYSLSLLLTNEVSNVKALDFDEANRLTFHPLTLLAAVGVALVVAWTERRMGNAPEFPVGLLVGELTVLATVLLHCVALVGGGPEKWYTLALAAFVVHLPIAVVEGIVLGFTVGFLARVKPEMLGWEAAAAPAETPAGHLANGPVGAAVAPEKTECVVDPHV
jgi:cobalt/nickel transport system permease protein